MDKLFGGPVAANDNIERLCPMCGSAVTGHQSKKFCCAKCRRGNERLNRDLDKERLRKKELSPERLCEHCGESFRRKTDSKNAARFCSRQCGFDAGSNVWKKPHVDEDLLVMAKALSVVYGSASCLCNECGSRFRSGSFAEKYCSQSCREKFSREQYIAANDNGRDRSERKCLECETLFAPEYGDRRRMFCSSECSIKKQRRITRKKNRARLRGAFVENVDPIAVFDRDSWICRECGRATPRDKRGTYDDDAPELDHIMPLSLGGAHSYMNTQCLCRMCNAKKSNTPPTQVSLFAYG